MAPAQDEQEQESLQETAARLRHLTEEQAVSEAAGEEGKQEEQGCSFRFIIQFG